MLIKGGLATMGKEDKAMLDKIFYMFKGYATKAGLILTAAGGLGAVITDSLAKFPADGDRMATIMWAWELLTKLGAVIAGYGGLRKWIASAKAELGKA